MIIIPWDESVESYVALGAQVEYERPPFCPACEHSDLIFWGIRKRFATDGKTSFVVFVRRLRCKGCGKTHTVLPAFLLKNQAYLVDLILLGLISVFVDGKGSRAVAEKLSLARSTLRRWMQRFKTSAAYHWRRLLFLRHNLSPDAAPPPPSGYPVALLALCAELFKGRRGGFAGLARWVSLTTCGRLLSDQPSMAP